MRQESSSVYQLRVTLKDSEPPIWRVLQVDGETTLHELHQALQIAIGWSDLHLHEFVIGELHYGMSEYDSDVKDERQYRLNQLAGQVRSTLMYTYDFGDGWEHEILVESILDAEPHIHYPRCIAGKRNCPPEDVGGIWSYKHFLNAIHDSKHPEHRNYLNWVGGAFDPEEFDLEKVNGMLGKL